MKLHLPTGLRVALLACLMGLPYAASAAYVWTGDTEITDASWNAKANWEVTEGYAELTDGKGPGTPGSNAWKTITISDASGTISTLEGWNLGMNLTDTSLTVNNVKKTQNGDGWPAATIDLTNSNLTLNIADGHQHKMNATLDNASSLTLNISKARTDGDIVNFSEFSAAQHGTLTVGRKSGATGTYALNLTLAGTFTDAFTKSESATLHEITLGTIGEGVSLNQLNSRIDANHYLLSSEPLTATEDNVGYYSIANDNGALKLYYVTGDLTYYTWDGGTGSWNDASWNSGSSIEGKSRVTINSGTVTIDAATEASTQILYHNGGNLNVSGSLQTTQTEITGGTVDVAGSLQAESVAISGSGKLKWGSSESSANLIDVAKISVDGGGAEFYVAHTEADLSEKTDLELKNGGKLYSFDTPFKADADNRGKQISFKNLNVTTGGGKIQYYWGGSFSFETVTGDANLAIQTDVGGNQDYWTIFKSIDNYSGTISISGDKHVVKLGSVNLSSGKTTTLNAQFGAIGETVTKTGAGTLILQGNGVDAATLDIRGGTVRWGSTGDNGQAEQNTAVLGFNKVVIGNGTTLEDSHRGGNTAVFDIEMQGGTLYAHAQLKSDAGVGVNYGTLTLKTGTNNNINQTWKSCRNFAVLTGGVANEDVSLTKLTIGNSHEDNMDDSFASVTDFNGTLVGASYTNAGRKLTIGAVNQASGFEAVLNAKVTLASGFTKTGAGSLTLGGETVLAGNASIEQGTVTMSTNDLKLKGNTLTLKGSGNAGLVHDNVTYTASSPETNGTITRTGDASLGLYDDGDATTLSNVTLTTSTGKAYSVTMNNVSLVSNDNATIWLTGTATKTIKDVTTGGTLYIGSNDKGTQSAADVTITGTAGVNSVQVSDIASLTVSGTVNAAANSSMGSLTLSGGTVTVAEHTGTLTVTNLTVQGENSAVNADLVVNAGGKLDFSSGSILTMGCGVSIGKGVTVVIDADLVSSIQSGTAVTIIDGIDADPTLTLGGGWNFVGAHNEELNGYGLALKAESNGDNTWKIVVAPEPATATLSLLALASLAARRKRR